MTVYDILELLEKELAKAKEQRLRLGIRTHQTRIDHAEGVCIGIELSISVIKEQLTE